MKSNKEVHQSCTQFISLHKPVAPNKIFENLAVEASDYSSLGDLDFYGEGQMIQSFEKEMAELLGHEAAVFLPSGTMAQQISMRVWCERRGISTIGFHPTCHLELDEEKGYSFLQGLSGKPIGRADSLMQLSDLESLSVPLGALIVELPQRRIGGELHSMEEILQFRDWASRNSVALHLDGARLWECGPHFKKSYAEIAGLFDSVYVSFYKGLGGIAGAILAGPADFVKEARVWQRRMGGNLIHLYPYVLSAKLGLRTHLAKMPEYCEKAKTWAAILNSIEGVCTRPLVPLTNMMHVFIQGQSEELRARALQFSEKNRIWLFGGMLGTGVPHTHKIEITIGSASLEVSDSDFEKAFREVTKS